MPLRGPGRGPGRAWPESRPPASRVACRRWRDGVAQNTLSPRPSYTQVLEVQGLTAPTPPSLPNSLCLPGSAQALAWVVPESFAHVPVRLEGPSFHPVSVSAPCSPWCLYLRTWSCRNEGGSFSMRSQHPL